MFNVFKTVLP